MNTNDKNYNTTNNLNESEKSKIEDITFDNNIITEDSFTTMLLDNTFEVFKSIDDILLLIYPNKNKSIISYNLTSNNNFNEIKNAHNYYITNIRHYFDLINKRDLILSISYEDNNLKIWNINFNCLINLKLQEGILYSGAILNNNNQNNIIAGTYSYSNKEGSIKIYDFNGNIINQINNYNNDIYIIDTYFDNKKNKNYIITGNENNVFSYDFNENKIYFKYIDNDDDYAHLSILIHNMDETIKLIESSTEGIIRIWNFHNGELLNKIKVINDGLYGMCLWNKDYLFVVCSNKTIKLININKGTIIKNLLGHKGAVTSVKKIIHPKYGECLVSFDINSIILWRKNK